MSYWWIDSLNMLQSLYPGYTEIYFDINVAILIFFLFMLVCNFYFYHFLKIRLVFIFKCGFYKQHITGSWFLYVVSQFLSFNWDLKMFTFNVIIDMVEIKPVVLLFSVHPIFCFSSLLFCLLLYCVVSYSALFTYWLSNYNSLFHSLSGYFRVYSRHL